MKVECGKGVAALTEVSPQLSPVSASRTGAQPTRVEHHHGTSASQPEVVCDDTAGEAGPNHHHVSVRRQCPNRRRVARVKMVQPPATGRHTAGAGHDT